MSGSDIFVITSIFSCRHKHVITDVWLNGPRIFTYLMALCLAIAEYKRDILTWHRRISYLSVACYFSNIIKQPTQRMIRKSRQFFGMIRKSGQRFNQALVKLLLRGFEINMNQHFVCYSIQYDVHCLLSSRLIQFHLSDWHTYSAHQRVARHRHLWYWIMLRTSGRFVNLW